VGNPEASIIIPVRDEWMFTRQCLAAIQRYTVVSHEVIVVDNGSELPPADRPESEGVRWIRNRWNKGFASAVNQGLEAARGEFLVWLNNDTLPSHRWLKQLLHVLKTDERVGMVGPVSNRVIPEQKIEVSLSSPAVIHRFSDRFNRTDPNKWRETKRLSGFCVAYPRRVLEKVGLLDERFGLGTYEDDDYSLRARRAGFRLIVAGDTYVHHFGNRSFKRNGYREFKKILRQNRRYYMLKWNID
jgi:GT2 family glycosyltransferase